MTFIEETMSAIHNPPPQYEQPENSYSVQEAAPVVKRRKLCSSASLKMTAATLCIAGAVATCKTTFYIVILLTVYDSVCSGVTMAEALQTLSKEYKNPFFMIYFVHSSYSILYIGWALWR